MSVNLINQYIPAEGWNPEAVPEKWLLFSDGKIVLPLNEGLYWTDIIRFSPDHFKSAPIVTGSIQGHNLAVAELCSAPEGLNCVSIRSVMETHSDVFSLLSHALQLITAMKAHRFCGQCGDKCLPKTGEWATVCQQCNTHFYPRISPCIIVLVTRGDEVFLVKHIRHGKESAMFTLMAGFVEPGESVENAVHREVKEESGLELGELKYCFSQSWPFPHALMMGFHAEYKSGEINLAQDELCEGEWFHKNHLPEIPPEFTISRQLIDCHL